MRIPPHLYLTLLFMLALVAVPALHGQQSGSTKPASSATPIPLSTRTQDGVTSQQTSLPSAPSSVNVINPTIQNQLPYTGSIPDRRFAGDVALSLKDAVERGLRFNLGQVSASTSLRQARAQRISARSELLPHVSASANETGSKLDLQAQGLSSNLFGGNNPLGAVLPTIVGPFHYYSLQGNVSATVLNLTDLYNFRSATFNADASKNNSLDARELVVLAVTSAYMQVLGTDAQVQAQVEQVNYADASYRQAKAQADAGTKADIDASRSLVQLQTEQLRLRSERNDLTKQTFSLARLLGLPVAAHITLTSKLDTDDASSMDVEQAVTQALSQRKDLKAQEQQVKVAEATLKAAHAERFPTASIQGYYGIQGINPNRGVSVFSATAGLSVPVFEGGRVRADVEQAKAALDQRQADFEDQKGGVELQVRSAHADLVVAIVQVQVAKSNHELALRNFKQSQDRFNVGAADSVEVVQSEQTLGGAAHDYVSALYAENVARINLARAVGVAEQEVQTLLKER